MIPFSTPSRRAALAAVPVLMLCAGTSLAHPGHDAPTVHSHTGSPVMLAVLAISVLGLVALVPLARLARRRRKQRLGR
ncbi:hypothetical protein [Halomonas sp. C05BenzN]|uniref:hypothetical protein n=1 Tax=Halomonas sp. C05BenzN TaxID=3411041 RepID=UPI003B95BEB5